MTRNTYRAGPKGSPIDKFITNIIDDDYLDHRNYMRIVTNALKDYDKRKTLKDFEEDYGCTIMYNEDGNISNVTFQNESCKTAFLLRYRD